MYAGCTHFFRTLRSQSLHRSYRLGADEFGAGVVRGSKRTTHGVFNTLSGITGSAAHGLASLTADRQFQRARDDFHSTDRPKTAYATTCDCFVSHLFMDCSMDSRMIVVHRHLDTYRYAQIRGSRVGRVEF